MYILREQLVAMHLVVTVPPYVGCKHVSIYLVSLLTSFDPAPLVASFLTIPVCIVLTLHTRCQHPVLSTATPSILAL